MYDYIYEKIINKFNNFNDINKIVKFIENMKISNSSKSSYFSGVYHYKKDKLFYLKMLEYRDKKKGLIPNNLKLNFKSKIKNPSSILDKLILSFYFRIPPTYIKYWNLKFAKNIIPNLDYKENYIIFRDDNFYLYLCVYDSYINFVPVVLKFPDDIQLLLRQYKIKYGKIFKNKKQFDEILYKYTGLNMYEIKLIYETNLTLGKNFNKMTWNEKRIEHEKLIKNKNIDDFIKIFK